MCYEVRRSDTDLINPRKQFDLPFRSDAIDKAFLPSFILFTHFTLFRTIVFIDVISSDYRSTFDHASHEMSIMTD